MWVWSQKVWQLVTMASTLVLVGRRVWHIALTPEEDKLYTTNGVSGDVTMVDVASLKAETTIKVGRYPWGVAVLPKEHIPQ